MIDRTKNIPNNGMPIIYFGDYVFIATKYTLKDDYKIVAYQNGGHGVEGWDTAVEIEIEVKSTPATLAQLSEIMQMQNIENSEGRLALRPISVVTNNNNLNKIKDLPDGSEATISYKELMYDTPGAEVKVKVVFTVIVDNSQRGNFYIE